MTVERTALTQLQIFRFQSMKNQQQRSQSRLILAFVLFATSIGASVVISLAANKSHGYWVMSHPLPQGVHISSSDIRIEKALLPSRQKRYFSESDSPIGLITLRNVGEGEFIDISAVSENELALVTEEVSIAVAVSDISMNARVGDLVAVYQVHDSRNGEEPIPPRRVLESAFISSLENGKNNFGGELTLTLAINSDQVTTLLASTASGRLVLVGSHG